jgi:hypothetical protein
VAGVKGKDQGQESDDELIEEHENAREMEEKDTMSIPIVETLQPMHIFPVNV